MNSVGADGAFKVVSGEHANHGTDNKDGCKVQPISPVGTVKDATNIRAIKHSVREAIEAKDHKHVDQVDAEADVTHESERSASQHFK